MLRMLFNLLFGSSQTCGHNFNQWSPPLRDMVREPEWSVGRENTYMPDSFQRRACQKCNLIEQRMIGVAMMIDNNDHNKAGIEVASQ